MTGAAGQCVPEKPASRPSTNSGAVLEERNPDAFAGIAISSAEGLRTIKEIALAEGMKPRGVDALLRRLRTRYPKTKALVDRVVADDLVPLLGDRAQHILESIDTYDLATASLKDKAIAAGILIDKHQLLSGEPTQILSVEDRRKTNELAEALLKEAQRRGVVLEGEYSDVTGAA